MFNLIKIFCVILLITLNTAHAQEAPSLLDYGALPTIQMTAISPNGDLLAYRKVNGDQDSIMVISLSKRKTVLAFDVSAIQPHQLQFFNNHQLFIRVSNYQRVAGFRGKFDLSTAYVLDVNEKKARQLLTPGDKIYAGQSGLGDVVGITPDGKYAFMPAYSNTAFDYEKPRYSLFKVNLTKKGVRLASDGDQDVKDFFVNSVGEVIAKEEFDEDKKIHKIFSKIDGKWVEIFKEKSDFRSKSFVGVTPDFKSLIMLDEDEKTDRVAYYSMSLSDGTISGPIMGRDDADIAAVISDIQRVVHGVRYSGFVPSYKFFDPTLDQRLNKIISNFPDQSVWLTSWSPDWKHLVVNVEGSNYADDYFLFSPNDEAKFLTSGRPQLKPEHLNPIGRVTFAARDGLKIPTLITIPQAKVTAMKNLPAIIYPHGGPAAHDMISFDYTAQALAAQGYLVIQPQFRGSSGFGLKHELAGHGEWGKKMQDDLTDTVEFFTTRGMIDPKRICIIGASYGGYAALAGGAFTPDLYKCVVSINGIGDINAMLKWDKDRNGNNSEIASYMEMQFSNGEVDKKELAEISPQNYATNFIASTLLIHSENDKRVPITQSEQMLKALEKAKKSVQLITLKGDNHHLLEGPSRLKALEETIKFVNSHLKH